MTLVILMIAEWDFRVMAEVSTLPGMLLLLLAVPPDEDDPVRRGVCRQILDAPDDKLALRDSDLGLKLKINYYADFRYGAETGKCSRALWAVMLVVRSMLPNDTQEIEGANSIITLMCKRAPGMHLPLVNARLSLKKGPSVVPEQCASYHRAVIALMDQPEASERFLIAPADLRSAPKAPKPSVPVEPVYRATARLCKSLGDHCKSGTITARHLWCIRFGQAPRADRLRDCVKEMPCVLLASSYYSAVNVVRGGIVDGVGDELQFLINLPVQRQWLADVVIAEFVRKYGDAVPRSVQLSLFRCTLHWLSRRRASLMLDSVTKKIFRTRPPQPAAKKARTDDGGDVPLPAPPAVPLADIDGGADDGLATDVEGPIVSL